MIKYVKLDYEVLEGTIESSIPEPTWKGYGNKTIALPDYSKDTNALLMPDPKDRYTMIQAARLAGVNVGARVIRVNHIKKELINNRFMIGVVQKFLWHMMPGYTRFLPILVRFNIGNQGYQDLPFELRELETLENAKKQLEIRDKIITNLQEDTTDLRQAVISDLLKERSGVIPFRDPKTFYH